MKKATAFLTLVFICMFCGPTGFAAPSSVAVLGQVVSSGTTMDGIRAPSGTALLNETRLRTGSSRAAIHLGNGLLLELDKRSSAFFERLPSGEVQVSLEKGNMSFREAGEVITVAADSDVVRRYTAGSSSIRITESFEALTAALIKSMEAGADPITAGKVSESAPTKSVLLKRGSRRHRWVRVRWWGGGDDGDDGATTGMMKTTRTMMTMKGMTTTPGRVR